MDQKIKANHEKMKTSPDEAFTELEELIAEAQKKNDKRSELVLLFSKYNYYYLQQADFNLMINSAEELLKKAVEYKDVRYEAVANKCLARAYIFNNLLDKASKELEKGLAALEKGDSDNQDIINEKANIYTLYSNLNSAKKDYKTAINYLYMAAEEHEKLKLPEQRRKAKFMDYSNMAGIYLEFNLDSAEYYAHKSISMSLGNKKHFNFMFLNYIVLGRVSKKRENYPKAISYFEKAENIKENKVFLNIKELYENLIDIHEILGNHQVQKEYEAKLKDIELTIAQKQSYSLQKLYENAVNEKQQTPNLLTSESYNKLIDLLPQVAVMYR